MRSLSGSLGLTRRTYIEIISRESRTCLSLQLGGECGLRRDGGKSPADRSARSRRYLLRMLQNSSGLEVWTCVRVQPKVQGRQVHHWISAHDQGERLGLNCCAGRTQHTSIIRLLFSIRTTTLHILEEIIKILIHLQTTDEASFFAVPLSYPNWTLLFESCKGFVWDLWLHGVQ